MVFFWLGEFWLLSLLDILGLAIRYVQWGCQLEAVVVRGTSGVQRSHPGSDQS